MRFKSEHQKLYIFQILRIASIILGSLIGYALIPTILWLITYHTDWLEGGGPMFYAFFDLVCRIISFILAFIGFVTGMYVFDYITKDEIKKTKSRMSTKKP